MQNILSAQRKLSLPDKVVVLSIMYLKYMKYLISRFLLHILSAEFQTSRSETRHKRTTRTLTLLGSCQHNLPSSAKIFILIEAHGINESLAMALL
jgi:hypothetical protein